MTRFHWHLGLVAVIGSLLAVATAPAHAQTALCPATVVGENGFVLTNGTCTNTATNQFGTGAFSGAALATQALSDLSQSATQETVRNTTSALQTRREEEQQRCPQGFARVEGQCVRNTPVAAPVTPVVPRTPVKASSKPTAVAVSRRRMAPPRVVQAPPPPVIAYPPPIYQSRYGTWALGFGNTEDRSAVGSTTINCCTGPVAGGLPNVLTITEKSHSSTYGFVGGFDYTSRSLASPDDGLVFGVLTGYIGSDFRIKTNTVSSTANVGSGSGVVNANLSGGSAGLYAIYFNGPFTADLTFKADVYDLTERFTDQLAFTANIAPAPVGLIAPGVVPFSGAGSGGLTNLSTFGDLSYRMFTLGPIWVEPTAGFQYTASLYDGRARRELGLDDGDLLMFQGGARFGMDTFMANRSRLTTSLTGLVYDDVLVSGGAIGSGQFGNNLLAKADEGEVRGRGILAVNYAMTNGVSLFAQGDVYGGDRLFGAGGKGGVRVEW